jgi:hypothetical protein
MWLRLITGVGLLALGYYVGKQVGRMEPIRDELERARADAAHDADVVDTGDSSGPAPG